MQDTATNVTLLRLQICNSRFMACAGVVFVVMLVFVSVKQKVGHTRIVEP